MNLRMRLKMSSITTKWIHRDSSILCEDITLRKGCEPMKVGDTIFTICMLILAFIYMKLTDYQIADLDKRVKVLEVRVSMVEHQCGLHAFKDKK
jgi:hypothetical protein